jgi:hypothetical protein
LSLLLSGPVCAWPSPREAIDKFIAFELAGGRLMAWDFSKYLAVAPGYEEPGWDEVHVVRSGVVQGLRCSEEACAADVLFTFEPTAGWKSGQFAAHPRGGHERVSYRLVRHGGQWLLAGSEGKPRVSLATWRRLSAP